MQEEETWGGEGARSQRVQTCCEILRLSCQGWVTHGTLSVRQPVDMRATQAPRGPRLERAQTEQLSPQVARQKAGTRLAGFPGAPGGERWRSSETLAQAWPPRRPPAGPPGDPESTCSGGPGRQVKGGTTPAGERPPRPGPGATKDVRLLAQCQAGHRPCRRQSQLFVMTQHPERRGPRGRTGKGPPPKLFLPSACGCSQSPILVRSVNRHGERRRGSGRGQSHIRVQFNTLSQATDCGQVLYPQPRNGPQGMMPPSPGTGRPALALSHTAPQDSRRERGGWTSKAVRTCMGVAGVLLAGLSPGRCGLEGPDKYKHLQPPWVQEAVRLGSLLSATGPPRSQGRVGGAGPPRAPSARPREQTDASKSVPEPHVWAADRTRRREHRSGGQFPQSQRF